MLLIFVDSISERLIYTLDFVFKDRAIEYEITNDWVYFCQQEKDKFVYSTRYPEHFVQILPSTLLFDEAIFNYAISKNEFYKEECLTIDNIIDPLASIFYVLSRYEEYIVKQRDVHERFEARNSLLLKYGWLEKVMCDRWAEDLISFLEASFRTKFYSVKIPFKIIPSIDIDNTFAFQWKDGIRSLLGSWKDKLKKDKNRVQARKKFKSGEEKDPYDTYDYLKEISLNGYDLHLFWLIGEYSKYDTNISSNDTRHQQLIREMSKFCKIGLHPSYKSNESIYFLQNEKTQIQNILKYEVDSSRQHFLKLSLPETYNNLISLGFSDDYTMGYADQVGFRAGTCRSYFYFDLFKNSVTKFKIHPFAYMDGTLNNYLKLSPNQAKEKIRTLFKEVKNYGGDFIFIWHNETIGDFDKWKDWKQVFEFSLNLNYEA